MHGSRAGALVRGGVRGAGAAIIAALYTFACSSSSGSGGGGGGGGGDGCAAICTKEVECNPTADEAACLSQCQALGLSSACGAAWGGSDCTEFGKDVAENPSWADACFPPCSTEGVATCGGSSITLCNMGRTYEPTCEFVCDANDLTYSGTCGPTFQGQACSNGSECCWCQ